MMISKEYAAHFLIINLIILINAVVKSPEKNASLATMEIVLNCKILTDWNENGIIYGTTTVGKYNMKVNTDKFSTRLLRTIDETF